MLEIGITDAEEIDAVIDEHLEMLRNYIGSGNAPTAASMRARCNRIGVLVDRLVTELLETEARHKAETNELVTTGFTERR